MKPRIQIIVQAGLLFLPSVILTAVISYLLFESTVRKDQIVLRHAGQEKVAQRQLSVQTVFKDIAADTRYVVSKLERAASDPKADLLTPAPDLASFAQMRKRYDHVRFLDTTGKERIRINLDTNGRVSITPEEKLQKKGDRYYFLAAASLEKGQLFVSPLDLNIERGTIETPFKPMIRFAGPVYDAGNKLQGVVVLNYLGEFLLSPLGNPVGAEKHISELMLIDSEGYWFKSDIPEDEWGFMLEDRRRKTFGRRFPETWRRIRNSENGQVLNEEGLFTYTTIHPLDNIGNGWSSAYCRDSNGNKIASGMCRFERRNMKKYSWKLIAWMPPDRYFAVERRFIKLMTAVDMLLLAAFLFGAFLLSRSRFKRQQAEKAAKVEADINAATGRLSKKIVSMSDFDEIAKQILQEAILLTRSTRGLAAVCDASMINIEHLVSIQDDQPSCQLCAESILSTFRDVARTGNPLIADRAILRRYFGTASSEESVPKQAVVSPASAEGETVGFVVVGDSPFPYTERDLSMLSGLANLFAIAVQRRRASERILLLAHFDQLTGLANRYLFEDRIKQTLLQSARNQEQTALMFIDLDKFKPINDTFGHKAGDAVLKYVADRLRNSVRASDTVARIGGDEFVIIVPNLASCDAFNIVAERILSSLQEPMLIEGQSLTIGASIGIAIYPDDAEDEERLKQAADAAMYQIKSSGRNGWKRIPKQADAD